MGGELLEGAWLVQAGAGRTADHQHGEFRPRYVPRRSSSATARRSTSGAFNGWIRPTNAYTVMSGPMPRCARDAAFEPGWKQDRSTPGRTVQTLSGSAA
ncbi:hypothetical protein GCM10029964_117080 [Kibdelosporangium lantanae]